MPPPPPSSELLLAHRGFLQRLARSLVVDEQRAEDVVQETYLAVLERPPPPRVRLRAWLGAIARNLALRSRRTQGRVRRRERRAARPESVTATDDVAARMETQRRVVEAVAGLAPEGRDAIVWRYFDGLSPSEIARRQGVSVRTIESRLRRARGALRRRLAGEHGEQAWRAALLPLAGWSEATLARITSAATTSATGGVPTASGLGIAAAAGATIMGTKTLVGIAAACAAAAFFAGWSLKPAPADLSADGTLESESVDAPLLGSEGAALGNLERDLEQARSDNESLRAAVKDLETRLAAAESAAPAGSGSEPSSASSRRYAPASLAEALEGTDFGAAGEAVANLVPLLARLESAFRDEVEMSPEEIAGISRWNSPLVQLALKVQGKVPGTGTNGAFTHPAVTVNLIAATLEQAGKPLSKAQLEMVSELGDRYLADDARRLQGYDEQTLPLQKALDETTLKDRFYASVDALLDAEQHDVLHPPTLRGRLGVDLFSSGVIWHPLSKPVSFSSRADLAPRMKALLVSQLELPETLHEAAEDAAAAWARSFTDAELALADDPILRASGRMSGGLIAGWARIELARACAQKMLALEHQLLERLPADSKGAKRLRSAPPGIVIPVKR